MLHFVFFFLLWTIFIDFIHQVKIYLRGICGQGKRKQHCCGHMKILNKIGTPFFVLFFLLVCVCVCVCVCMCVSVCVCVLCFQRTTFIDFIHQKKIQSNLIISNSKGLSEILRDIRTSTYQICRVQEKIIRLTIFNKYI